MAEFPGLTIWTDAWIADTAHLSRAERGLYMDMLILCWRSPNCQMPNHIDWVARKLGCSGGEIDTLEVLISEFMQSTGNWLTQKRLKKEFEFVRRRVKKQSDKAKSRWNKEKDICRGNAPTPTPTPTPKEEERTSLESSNNLASSVARADAPRLDEGKEKGSGKKVNGHPVKATRLDPDWMPSEDDCQIGIDLGLTPAQIEDQHHRFQDYWIARPGAGGLKLNWGSTFRNWLRKAADDKHARR